MTQAAPDRADVRGYLLVTACYQAFTLSDGALRMLVLLHLHEQGQTGWALALMLLPYEVAGVVTNLLGGYLGARFGLKATLVLGLAMQVVACAMLTVDAAVLTIGYVMATQVLSGVAKDLAKTSAKSYVRVLAPERADDGLFRMVAVMTGSKNAIKGLGFFLGGALLATTGFRDTNVALAVLLSVAALCALSLLPRRPGNKAASLRGVFAHDAATNWLSTARLFLFGSRDAWFAIALPLFLAHQGWSTSFVGGFLAAWVIAYGVVQASAPRLVRATDTATGVRRTVACNAALLLPLLATTLGLWSGLPPVATLAVGLCLYGGLFALTSSLHSWLIVALHGKDKVAERVGFYYAANALGRVVGLLASGWLYASTAEPQHGLVRCLGAAMGTVVLAALATLPIRR